MANFYTLGKMSGEKAARILRDKVAPASIQSEVQDPPLFLANRNSLKVLGIVVFEEQQERSSGLSSLLWLTDASE